MFQPLAEQFILQAIAATYSELSPENLTCDGELPFARVQQKRSELNRRLDALFQALGRQVDETEVYQWDRQRCDWLKQRK